MRREGLRWGASTARQEGAKTHVHAVASRLLLTVGAESIADAGEPALLLPFARPRARSPCVSNRCSGIHPAPDIPGGKHPRRQEKVVTSYPVILIDLIAFSARPDTASQKVRESGSGQVCRQP